MPIGPHVTYRSPEEMGEVRRNLKWLLPLIVGILGLLGLTFGAFDDARWPIERTQPSPQHLGPPVPQGLTPKTQQNFSGSISGGAQLRPASAAPKTK